MAKIAIIGAGMVGSTMALDLAGTHEVALGDLNKAALDLVRELQPAVQTRVLDVTNTTTFNHWLKGADLVLCAVPGFLGYSTLQNIIEAGKNCVDISFMPEDALELNSRAVNRGITVIVDSGVAPGMSNLILGDHNREMEVHSFTCLVGGLPLNPEHPFGYKAPFSPLDVIEEYSRPARMIVEGKLQTRPALSDIETVELSPVGTLEAFNTDGLRSLLKTMSHIPNMVEKTLRYPGHAALMKVLKDSGFFSQEKIRMKNGQILSPLELSSELLSRAWQLKPGEGEFTIMEIVLRGRKGSTTVEIRYHLYDEYDPESGFSSMARTTGFTATAMVNLVLDGLFRQPGVFPPEIVGAKQGCLDYILAYLKERGVNYQRSEKEMN